MKKITSCDRYKIGFFVLLIIIVAMFGYFVSSSKTNLSYKNRASNNELKPLPVEGETTQGQEGVGEPDLNNFGMIATITSLLPDAGKKDTYRITFKEVPFTPIGEGGDMKEGAPAMLFENAAAQAEETPNPSQELENPTELTCTFVGASIPQMVQVPLPEQRGENGTVSQDVGTKTITVPLDDLIAEKNYESHTYLIEYKFVPEDQRKDCVIKTITIQQDSNSEKPSPTPTQ